MRSTVLISVLAFTAISALGQQLGVGQSSVTLRATIGEPITSVAPLAIRPSTRHLISCRCQIQIHRRDDLESEHSAASQFRRRFAVERYDRYHRGAVVWHPHRSERERRPKHGPGTNELRVNFSTVDQSPPSSASVVVFFHLFSPAAAPVIASVVNAASLQSAVSLGAMVSIFGANFGPPAQTTHYDDAGFYPTDLPSGSNSSAGGTRRFSSMAQRRRCCM